MWSLFCTLINHYMQCTIMPLLRLKNIGMKTKLAIFYEKSHKTSSKKAKNMSLHLTVQYCWGQHL